MAAGAETKQTIQVKVRLYAALRRYIPGLSLGETTVLELPNGATLGDLLERLTMPRAEVKIRFVNGLQRDPDHRLQDGDEIALFPPVGGG